MGTLFIIKSPKTMHLMFAPFTFCKHSLNLAVNACCRLDFDVSSRAFVLEDAIYLEEERAGGLMSLGLFDRSSKAYGTFQPLSVNINSSIKITVII